MGTTTRPRFTSHPPEINAVCQPGLGPGRLEGVARHLHSLWAQGTHNTSSGGRSHYGEVTSGKQDRGTRATLGLAWACTALAMGQTVALFLTMDGAVWAEKDAAKGVKVAGFEALHAYLEQFLGMGGKLLVCAPCTKYYCGCDGASTADKLHPAAQLAGLSTIVGQAGQHAQIVTF